MRNARHGIREIAPMRQLRDRFCKENPTVKCEIIDAGLCNNCAGVLEPLPCDDAKQILRVKDD